MSWLLIIILIIPGVSFLLLEILMIPGSSLTGIVDFGIRNYYKFRNLQADTRMLDSISDPYQLRTGQSGKKGEQLQFYCH